MKLPKVIHRRLKVIKRLVGGALGYMLAVKVRKQPYFGNYHFAGQLQPKRMLHMSKILSRKIKGGEFINILEIGAWAGGSAVYWANTLKYLGGVGQVLCVDEWSMYDDARNYGKMARAIRGDAVYRLFQHNVKTSGNGDTIKHIRGKSDDCLPLLRGGWFDIIYIDGDHSYRQVYRDIINSLRLVKENGVICGDDYSFPGVKKAISEVWREGVEDLDGFWVLTHLGEK